MNTQKNIFSETKVYLKALIAQLLLIPLLGFAGTSYGTGFFITVSGHIVTNYHVIEGATEIAVRDVQGQSYEAKVLSTDKSNDLAVLKVQGVFHPLPIARSNTVRRGEQVFTLGFPNPQLQGTSIKFTEGSISSLAGIQDEPNNFQMSIPIQPGNSGGPLINREGFVVGVVVAKLDALAALKSGSTIPEVVNYAVKSNYLFELITSNSLIADQIPQSSKKNKSLSLADRVSAAESSIVLIESTLPKNAAGKSAQPVVETTPPRSSTPPVYSAPRVQFQTSQGEFVVELYPEKAPKTVNNFLQYVNAKFYDGLIFHRVIPNFMVQGGGYNAKYEEKIARPPISLEALNGLKNEAGTIAMARTNDPNSARAQFFVNVKDNPALNAKGPDDGYTVFGRVISGMDTINKIKDVPTGSGGPFRTDAPHTPVVIYSTTQTK